jgi:hypothetical protein
LERYKLLIFEKTKLSLTKFVATLLLEILDNLCILLKALESLDIELPTEEKSIELSVEFLSFGDNII